MSVAPVQLTLGDADADYAAFLDKFKPKKTTDDCYTPPRVYEVVADYVARRFGRDRSAFVRPFWPGGDYQRVEYPEGCTVVDNPPFSIITPIVEWYASHRVPFFLFAPYLPNLGIARRRRDVTHLFAPVSVRYENGAEVATAFVHNLSPEIAAEADPELRRAIQAADDAGRSEARRNLPRYVFPPEVQTSSSLGYLANHGVACSIPRAACAPIGALDAMRLAGGKSVFGTGLLLSSSLASEVDRLRAEAAARPIDSPPGVEVQSAERVWQLSDRERRMVDMLDRAAT